MLFPYPDQSWKCRRLQSRTEIPYLQRPPLFYSKVDEPVEVAISRMPGNTFSSVISLAFHEPDYDVIRTRLMTAKRSTREGGLTHITQLR
jgi:hypothetical protein